VIHAKTHTLEVCREFSLMIDMKTGGDEAFNTLHNLLGEYNAQYPVRILSLLLPGSN